MKKKINVLIVTLLICITVILVTPDDWKIKATSGGDGEGDIGLNCSYIYEKTEELSKVIDEAYFGNDLRKGRVFGSEGEHLAKNLIKNWMENELDLYTTVDEIESKSPLWNKSKENEWGNFIMIKIPEKIDILEKAIKINGTEDIDCHIRPRWNKTGLDNVRLLYKYPRNKLTHNFSYSNVKIKHRKYDLRTKLDNWLYNISDDILDDENIDSLMSLLGYILLEYEEDFGFTWEDWIENPVNSSNHAWYDSFNQSLNAICSEKYVFIDSIDPGREPLWWSALKELEEKIPIQLIGLLSGIVELLEFIEMLLWNFFSNVLPCSADCIGLMLYDFNNETYNMDLRSFMPLPTIYINGSLGMRINNSVNNYTMDFWLNQSWNSSVESYNVIGQINGTDPNKTVILSCLYDSWWNQGTADAAIGMAMVLGIAKYFNDYNITPKYNLKFIAFGGEEYGCRGSYSYEGKTQSENVITIIDLNQLGFKQEDPELELKIRTNNVTVNNTLWEITNETHYLDRVDNVSNLSLIHVPKGRAAIGNYQAYADGGSYNRSTNWIYIVKNTEWLLHHRDGNNHTKGDVIDYYDPVDANITTEMILNITKYYAVDPDCWFENDSLEKVDVPEDEDSLPDSINTTFTINTSMPHDRVMVNATLTKSGETNPTVKKYVNYTVTSTNVSDIIMLTVPEDGEAGWYKFILYLYNSTGRINELISLNVEGYKYNDTSPSNLSPSAPRYYLYPLGANMSPPVITNITDTPDPVGYGNNVTITADVTDNVSSVEKAEVYIDYPDGTFLNYSMNNTAGDTYEYNFSNTWQKGEYSYYIWAIDNLSNSGVSDEHFFNVSVEANISVCTVKDNYGSNETVNITDPPIDDGLPEIGYELLDNDEVLHIWNKYDSYYFNTSSGIQITNHYNEYWSHNVLMLGYYNNDQWNLIYRTDELSGFTKTIDSDNETYVNITLWKDLTYQGYDFRLAIRYYLGVNDNELTIIPYIKNIDDEDIPYNLGFAWEIKDIQIDMTTSDDYIVINGTSYFLNQSLDETYKNIITPCFYIREDINSFESESLYLRWNENLNYIVRVESRDGQYNAPVTLGIKIGTLNIGQEKSTSLFWHDASEAVYYFNGYDSVGVDRWETNPGNMVDGNSSTYASTTIDGDIQLCNTNTCNGSDGTISKVELRCYGYYSGDQRDTILRPVFSGISDGDNHNFVTPPAVGEWSQWFDITSDTNAPSTWIWNDVSDLDCDVEAGSMGMFPFTLYCSKVEVRVTYNVGPVVYNLNPSSGTTGVSIIPTLSVNVADNENDMMNITWLSNSSGSWVAFGWNNSVYDGIYYQTFSNASVNGQWWYWKVNVSDGTTYTESSVYSLYTGFESKVNNSGSTDFKGYLLMQIEYYNTSLEEWVVDLVVVNETSPRSISSGGVLALDTIFNAENVSTSSFQNNNGSYRVYACLRDPDGDVLYVSFPSQGSVYEGYLEDSYEFTVTYS
jgi:hypothetical protein